MPEIFMDRIRTIWLETVGFEYLFRLFECIVMWLCFRIHMCDSFTIHTVHL